MSTLTSLSIRRPVATVMFYLIFMVIGVVSARSLAVDLLPKIEFARLTVDIEYPHVGPEEIEQIVTDRIENAVSGVPDLRRITSQSEEGQARIRLEFERGTNLDEAANEVRAALDRVRGDLPVETRPPEIYKLDLDRDEVMNLVATTTRSLPDLTRLLERDIARRLRQIPGVGVIQLRGGIYREIRIDLHRDQLQATGVTALDVREALVRENLTLPAGNVKRGLSDLHVRAVGDFRTVEQIAQTVVTSVEGMPVRVRDVAEVRDGHRDVSYLAEVNGVPSVSLGIQKQSGANTVEVADRIRAEMARINAERDDLYLTVFADQSQFIRDSIANVRNSAVWGALLAIAVLYVFLRSRASTAIIAVSIPISVISAFGLLYFGGLTLNQMTFGGLALGVGMIVDSAIVVLESIVRKREEGATPRTAAERGTSEVAGAITASTLTTCVIFLPVVFTRTTSGALFQALALVVVFALTCSLVVALTLVPMLAARLLGKVQPGALRPRTGAVMRIEAQYVATLRKALRHRTLVFAGTTALVAAAAALWRFIPVELAPQTDADEIDVEIEMAEGTNIAVVRSYMDELETKVREALPPGVVDLVSTEVRGSNAEVEIKLRPRHLRIVSGQALADKLRAALEGAIPGAEIEVEAQPGLSILRRLFSSGEGGRAIEIELRGWDLARADQIAAQMRQRMERVAGVTGVRVSRREGRPEERLFFDRERIAAMGLSVRDVSRTVQANVAGVEAGRLRDAGEEFPIVVRLKPEDRLTGQDLGNVMLRTPQGALVPLSAVVSRDRGRGPTEIDRIDGQRVTYLTAGLESGVALGDAVDRVRSAFGDLPLPEGYSIVFGGEYLEQQEARRDFLVAIAMALVLVYMLMAAQFEKLVDPLIVMLSVPVALIGVVPTLLLTGTTLNIQSVMGLVMLIGIVVNNAIVLVDTINLLRRERQMDTEQAVLEAGRLRLRPILMTTTTTVLGLAPLALGLGVGGEIQAALARVVIGGLVASTLVTLFLIPVAIIAARGARSLRDPVHAFSQRGIAEIP